MPGRLQASSRCRQPHFRVVGLHDLAQHMLAIAPLQVVSSFRQHLPRSHVMRCTKGRGTRLQVHGLLLLQLFPRQLWGQGGADARLDVSGSTPWQMRSRQSGAGKPGLPSLSTDSTAAPLVVCLHWEHAGLLNPARYPAGWLVSKIL